MRVYRARWLLTIAAPPIEDGAIAVDGLRVAAAGPAADVIAAAGDADVRDLQDTVLLPGLVNAHTHVELSWLGESPPHGGSFIPWLRELLARRASEDEASATRAAEEAIRGMVARGTVAAGDVANGVWVAGVLARSSLRGVAFHEIYGSRSADAETILVEAADRLDRIESGIDEETRMPVVLTPHAAHTTSANLLKALAGRAGASAEPLSIHVAESREETELLADGSGPFAELLRERGMWDDDWEPPGHSPVEYLDRLGVLGPRTLAVHCVHLDHQDVSRLQARRVTVVTCPRSNARLGVGLAPVPKLLGSGIPVALGTDSLASVPDLDLFAEMASLRSEHPGLSPAAVVRMATLNGARALGLGDDLGSLEPGKLAALLAVPLPDPASDPLEAVTTGPADVTPLEAAAEAGP